METANVKKPGIKSPPNKSSWKRREEKKRSKWAANNAARADMNSKMSSYGSSHMGSNDGRCMEFHRFLDSFRVRTMKQA